MSIQISEKAVTFDKTNIEDIVNEDMEISNNSEPKAKRARNCASIKVKDFIEHSIRSSIKPSGTIIIRKSVINFNTPTISNDDANEIHESEPTISNMTVDKTPNITLRDT